MNTLEDTVKQVVNDFVTTATLFTALDVSNEVKKTMPASRHREVRDIVRSMYADIQLLSYGRTPINVILEDGTTVEALLYHPLADSWDLDTKYDTQKRTQSAIKNASAPPPSVIPAAIVTPLPKPAAVVLTAVTTATTTVSSPKQMWDKLFDNTNLFPKS